MENNIVDLSSDIISNVCMEGKSYADLPLDVIYEVLLKLPIEDLMRCLGVCRTWNNLINEPDFHIMQFERALSQPLRVLLAQYFRRGPDLRFSIYLMNNEKCREIPVEDLKLYWRYTITNSCNGLICIVTGGLYDPVYIYNPITRESTELPEQEHESFKFDGVLYGFGFDEVSKKYKVICVYRPYYWDSDYYEGNVTEKSTTTGEIITEGEDSWRKIEFPYQIEFSQSRAVFLDGAFHWMISRDHGTSESARILVFDISNEKFQTINIPPSVGIPDSTILTDIAGSLTFVQYDSLDTSAQIWRIVGSGTGDRCIQKYSCEFISKTDGVKYFCRVIGRCSNGGFLYKATDYIERSPEDERYYENKANDHLAVYVPEKKQSFILQMVGAPNRFDTVFFKPTLVSPKSIYFPTKPKIAKEKKGRRRWWEEMKTASEREEMETASEREEMQSVRERGESLSGERKGGNGDSERKRRKSEWQ